MSAYVLDTDHLTLHRRGDPNVVRRVAETPPDELAITIISIEEQFRGWFTQVRKARTVERLARAYEGLFDVIEMARNLHILPFTRTAVDRYLELRTLLPRLGKQDLAIAAISIDANAVVITRNTEDFAQVPGLQIEDWSLPEP